MKLILWDIDGTLLRGGAAAANAFKSALRTTYNLQGELARISYGGKTDGQIALELVGHHDIAEAYAAGRLDAFREAYTRELELCRQRLQSELQVLPGVREVLEHLRALNVYQTVLTGNFLATARIKLACAGLIDYLDLEAGAFGSDHHDRNCLVPIALQRAQQRYRDSLAAEQVVVIGDTPRDILCARAGNARAVAVATGSYAAEELAPYQPDALLTNLSDTGGAVAAILGE